MLDENDIIEAVCSHLEREGYEIVQRLRPTDKGVDVVGKRSGTDETILIEAKGGTSSRQGSPRSGKPYTQSQVFDLVSKGFFAVCRLLSQKRPTSCRVALAVPDERWFRKYLESIHPALHSLGILVLFVAENRSIRLA